MQLSRYVNRVMWCLTVTIMQVPYSTQLITFVKYTQSPTALLITGETRTYTSFYVAFLRLLV